MNKGVLRSQIESSSLVVLAAARIIRDEGIKGHTKCSKRTNVFNPHDLLVAKTAAHEVDEYANNSRGCPFSTTQGCSLINGGLTVPSLCIKRIIVENSKLVPLEKKLNKAYLFLKQVTKLVGVKE